MRCSSHVRMMDEVLVADAAARLFPLSPHRKWNTSRNGICSRHPLRSSCSFICSPVLLCKRATRWPRTRVRRTAQSTRIDADPNRQLTRTSAAPNQLFAHMATALSLSPIHSPPVYFFFFASCTISGLILFVCFCFSDSTTKGANVHTPSVITSHLCNITSLLNGYLTVSVR